MLKASNYCPICGGPGKPLAKSSLANSMTLYLTCIKCKSIFASKKATRDELLTHYSTYYTQENLGIPEVARNSLVKTVTTFSKFRTVNNTICDLGFGAGALLDAAQANNWKCAGSEYSADAIVIGRSKGWEVHQGDLTSEALRGPYDVVTIIETLEHVQNPREFLVNASVRLRSGGLLYGTTPNSQSINASVLKHEWSVISFPEHPILMSKKALKVLLRETGFEQVTVKSRGLNPYDLIFKFRRKFKPISSGEVTSFNPGRVNFGYTLNSAFSKNLTMRILKAAFMVILGKTNTGDSLVFMAVKI
jgi:2-polyprenyl-3-methyl-5-hydroxy-6-metoxy-1,4-benzoquinol methylase